MPVRRAFARKQVKRLPWLWLHDKLPKGAFPEKEYWAEMVCYFTGVYMTNKTLYDRLQIQNFYSCIQKSSFVRYIHT